jgi:hypothetical protein
LSYEEILGRAQNGWKDMKERSKASPRRSGMNYLSKVLGDVLGLYIVLRGLVSWCGAAFLFADQHLVCPEYRYCSIFPLM